MITIRGIIIGYIQWQKGFRGKIVKLRDEASGEHTKVRVNPYSELLQQLEILSLRNNLGRIQSNGKNVID